MKYRRLVSLTDEEITFAMKDIFHCTEINEIILYKKINKICVKVAISFQNEIFQKTILLKEDGAFVPWINSHEEEKRWEQFLLAKGCHSLLEDNPYLEQSYYLVSSNGYDVKYASYFLFLSDSQSSALLFHSFAFKEKNGWDYHIIFANRAKIRRFL